MTCSRIIILSLYLFASLSYWTIVNAQVSSDSPVTATVPSSASPDSQAPSAPILIRPIDATVTSDPIPEFVWKRSVDPNGNTVLYTVYIDDVAMYLGVSDLGNSSGPGYTARIEDNEIKLLPTVDLSEGFHKWYVTAEDLSGNRSSSTTWHFTIDRTPPFLILEELEHYHLPTITTGTVFELTGPRDIHFTIRTESFTTILVTIVNDQGSTLTTLSYTTDQTGYYYPYHHLGEGRYSVLITALDQANLTSALPEFGIAITVTSMNLPSLPPLIRPPIDLPDKITIPPFPSLPSLPATIAKLTTRSYMPITLTVLLALGIWYMLFLIWKKRYNLYLRDDNNNPVDLATIYHSPGSPTIYYPDDLGRARIPTLGRYSTLTIRVPKHNKIQEQTIILSISRDQREYLVTV